MHEDDLQAETTEAALAAALVRQASDGDRTPDTGIAAALVAVATTIRPDPGFAAALEARLRAQHASFRIAPRWPRRLALLAATLLLTLLSLLAVPQVRARVLDVLRIGVISVEQPEARQPQILPPTPLLRSSPAPPPVLQGLAGATTMEQARTQLNFPLLLPRYPADLGPPDKVFVQELGGSGAILVWLDPDDAARLRLALFVLRDDAMGRKSQVQELQQTTVGGRPALWVRGPHLLQIAARSGVGEYVERQLVSGDVLIWEQGGLTYRLESRLPLDEAVKLAESLRE